MTNPYVPAGFFLLRTPTLPWRARLWTGDCRAELERTPFLREGICIASPGLYAALASDADLAEDSKLARAVSKYKRRMATRSTPFGAFAAVAMGRIADRSELSIGSMNDMRLETRLDSGYLESLLNHTIEIRPEHWYVTNDSAYWLGDRVHYYESRLIDGSRERNLVCVWDARPHKPYLDAMANARPLAELIELVQEDGLNRTEAWTYINDLIAAQLLLPAVGPTTVGDSILPHDWLTKSPSIAAGQIAEAVLRAGELGHSGKALCQNILALAADSQSVPGWRRDAPPVQADLFRDTEVSLSARVAQEICDECYNVWKVLGKSKRPLQGFASDFSERFGHDFVPLLEVADAEIGVLDLTSSVPTPTWDDFSRLTGTAQTRILHAVANHEEQVCLAETDFADRSSFGELEPEPSWAAQVTLLADSTGSLDHGAYEFRLVGTSGPSGIEMFSRFAHGLEGLKESLRHHCAREQEQTDAVLVEVVHFPDGHLGNIVFRPSLREVETTFLGRSTAERTRLPLSDLNVGVRGGRVLLYSSQLRQYVLPRLTTAHNFQQTHNLPVYRFLGLIATQRVVFTNFAWGSLARSPFLPRVRLGRAIVAPAQWRVDNAQRTHSRAGGVAGASALSQVEGAFRLPRLVQIGSFDSVMVFSLDQSYDRAQVERLLAAAQEPVILTEVLPPNPTLVKDSDGDSYSHEIVVPFIRDRPSRIDAGLIGAVRGVATCPSRGSNWIQLNIYTGPTLADELIGRFLGPFISRCKDAGILKRWFFIRYADPAYHLRFRICSTIGGGAQLATFGRELKEALLSAQIVQRVVAPDYEPETARYGGRYAIEIAEDVFQADSELAVALTGSVAPLERDTAVIGAIWHLLHQFGLSDDAVLQVVLAKLRGEERSRLKQWNAEYRPRRTELNNVVDLVDAGCYDAVAGRDDFGVWARRMAKAGHAYRGLDNAHALATPMESIVSSFVHMHCNRIAMVDPNQLERRAAQWLTRIIAHRSAIAAARTVGEARRA
jgi:lantibiotic biosynthesis protein